jgi:GR25 family glycosyltransferase involved in LPS biosynthesis
MKPQKLYNFILFVVILGFVSIVLYRMLTPYSAARIDDIWVINLDRDTERWNHMRDITARFGGIVHRFPGMDGKTITERDSIHKEGVGFYFTRISGKGMDEFINKGVVGCWLSHKRLLTHLSKQDHQNDYGHLVLEDDVVLPDDFLSGNDVWSKISKYIPGDWDIVYLGMAEDAKGSPIADNIVKLSSSGKSQHGTYAYLVKHGSIKTKLLPGLRFMTDSIDEQYSTLFDDINAYCIRPSIINCDETVGSKSSVLAIH